MTEVNQKLGQYTSHKAFVDLREVVAILNNEELGTKLILRNGASFWVSESVETIMEWKRCS